MIPKLILLSLVVLLAACGSPAPATQPPDPLSSTSWVLESLNGQPVDIAAGITLAFSDGGTLNGSDGCNDYTAGYTAGGTSLGILAPVSTTNKGCAAEITARGAAYLQALTAAVSYKLEGQKLQLLSGDGTVLASFQQVNP